MRYKLLNSIVFFVLCFALSGTFFSVSAENDDYYIVFKNDENNNATVEVGTYEVITVNASSKYDLSNIKIEPFSANTVLRGLEPDSTNASDAGLMIRITLLKNGYAKLVNENIATEAEISAQQKAREEKIGIWNKSVGDEVADFVSAH